MCLEQARRQDSVIGGTRTLFMWIRECGSNEKDANQKNNDLQFKNFHNSGFHLKNLAIFYEFWGKEQKKNVFSRKISTILVFISKIFRFSTNSKVKTKKSLRPKIYAKFNEIRFESTKLQKKQFLLMNSRAISTILGVLGLNLHSSNPKPVNFLGAQSSFEGGWHNIRLGGHKQLFGGTAPKCPPVAPGLIKSHLKDLDF